MSFMLYVFTLPKPGKDIKLELRPWEKLRSNQRVVHQTVRRVLNRPDTPMSFTVPASDQEAYAAVLALAKTSEEMKADFERMAAEDKQGRAAVKVLASLGELLTSTREMLKKG